VACSPQANYNTNLILQEEILNFGVELKIWWEDRLETTGNSQKKKKVGLKIFETSLRKLNF
jgi:hypothetical protein